jgi:hypothetical protein
MTAPSEPPSVFGVAAGIADADRVGASAKAQAANPINKSRFILVSPPLDSRYRDKEESFGASLQFHFGSSAFTRRWKSV